MGGSAGGVLVTGSCCQVTRRLAASGHTAGMATYPNRDRALRQLDRHQPAQAPELPVMPFDAAALGEAVAPLLRAAEEGLAAFGRSLQPMVEALRNA